MRALPIICKRTRNKTVATPAPLVDWLLAARLTGRFGLVKSARGALLPPRVTRARADSRTVAALLPTTSCVAAHSARHAVAVAAAAVM